MRYHLIAALAALSLAGTAHAESPKEISISVSHTDLDLSTEAGIKTLELRIASAARRVCRRTTFMNLQQGAAFENCRKKAVEGAMVQVAALDTVDPVVFAGR